MGTENVNTNKKFVAVLNKSLPQGTLMNALAHMAACLAAKYPDAEEMSFIDYVDKDSGKHPVSALTFIILEGNSNKIRELRKEAIANGIHFVDFTNTMTQDTYVEQLERTKNTPEAELEYYGICMFGDKEKINPLTRKFSLWK